MKKQNWGLVPLLILALLVTSCGQPATGAQEEDTIKGTITVSGAWALYPLMVRWGEEFHKVHPDVKFDISAGGAGKDSCACCFSSFSKGRSVSPETRWPNRSFTPFSRIGFSTWMAIS